MFYLKTQNMPLWFKTNFKLKAVDIKQTHQLFCFGCAVFSLCDERLGPQHSIRKELGKVIGCDACIYTPSFVFLLLIYLC